MVKSRSYSLLICFVMILLFTFPVRADGIIVPNPPPDCIGEDCYDPILPRPISQLVIQYHHVDVQIQDQIAEVHVDQEFYNPSDWSVEGFYVFPLPINATVSEFTLWVDGEAVKGEVLNAQEARRVYEDSVRQLKDPALLEYIGHGAIKASVFPIPPDGTQRIELKYLQILSMQDGLVNFGYPLNTEKFSALPLDEVKIEVNIQSSEPLRAVYSLSHEVQVVMEDELSAEVYYQERDSLPDKDFELSYSVGQDEGIHLLSYHDSNSETGEEGGYFTLLIAPPAFENMDPVAKDLLFVLDRSGSMEGEKFQQAQSALIYILEQLNPEDRFYLTAFNDTIQSFSGDLKPISAVEDAVRWVEKLSPSGSTDINRALLETISAANLERPTYLIFLTDGLPTEGETDSQTILDNFHKFAPESLRAFVFGVGYDVDTYLLDTLSEEHHGISTYVKPAASLQEMISGFYNKIRSPVLTDLDIVYSKTLVYDIYPRELPDLFVGSQIIVVGRYKGGGDSLITLSGTANGKTRKIVSEKLFFDDGKQKSAVIENSIPRLWATRKIGYLLKEIRLKGNNPELVDQIVQLSIRYGIVTPYTSFLVAGPDLLGNENQTRLSQEVYEKFEAVVNAPAYGVDAFQRAAEESELAGSSVAAPLPRDLVRQVKIIGDRAFLFEEGVWIDTLFDPENMKVVEIEYLSKEYFEAAELSPDVAAWLALGKHVIFVKENTAYRVIDEEDFVWEESPTGKPIGLESDLADEELAQDSSIAVMTRNQENSHLSANDNHIKVENSDNYNLLITAGVVFLVLVMLFLAISYLYYSIIKR